MAGSERHDPDTDTASDAPAMTVAECRALLAEVQALRLRLEALEQQVAERLADSESVARRR